MIQTRCVSEPQSCSLESVPAVDRFLIGMEDPRADAYSFTTQNLAVLAAFSASPLIQGALVATGALAAPAALAAIAADSVLVLQSFAWNGLVTEMFRLVVQRPRPFVYADPARARLPSNYTSFVSGHTSAAATGSSAAWLVLLSRGAPGWLLLLFGAAGYALVSMTGVYRMLAGRHFLTDVVCGAIVGGVCAFFVAYFHRPRPEV